MMAYSMYLLVNSVTSIITAASLTQSARNDLQQLVVHTTLRKTFPVKAWDLLFRAIAGEKIIGEDPAAFAAITKDMTGEEAASSKNTENPGGFCNNIEILKLYFSSSSFSVDNSFITIMVKALQQCVKLRELVLNNWACPHHLPFVLQNSLPSLTKLQSLSLR